MNVWSGTSVIYMDMASPDRRECVLKSSESNTSLAALICRHSDLMMAVMLDALTGRRPRLEGKLLVGVVGCRWRKMSMPVLTGEAVADSEQK